MSKLTRDIYQNYLRTLNRLDGRMTHAKFIALRRAAMTLRKWYEHECNGLIERDESDGAPYICHTTTRARLYKTADREKGAIKRIDTICEALGMHYYLQTDPRGGTLYVDIEPIPDNNYTRAVFIA